MKLSYFYIFLVLIMLSSCGIDDPDSPRPYEVFVKYYGEGTNTAVDLATYQYMENEEEKTGFLVLASHNDGELVYNYIIRTDEQGNEVDADTISVGNQNVAPRRIKAIGDGRYLVVGSRLSNNSVIGGYWFHMDTALSVDTIYTTTFEALDITKVQDADEVILIGNENDDIVLAKRDFNNQKIWKKFHGFPQETEKGLAVFENPNGNILFVGSTTSQPDGEADEGVNVYVLETNSLGTADQGASPDALNNELALLSADDIPTAVIRTPVGYAITGYTTVNGDSLDAGNANFIMNISNNGAVNETHVFQYHRQNDPDPTVSRALAMTRNISGDYVIVGTLPNYTDSGIGKQGEVMVMRVNPVNGFVPRLREHCHSYGRISGNDAGNAVLSLPDGDIMMAATIDYGSGVSLISLMRLNKNGALVN